MFRLFTLQTLANAGKVSLIGGIHVGFYYSVQREQAYLQRKAGNGLAASENLEAARKEIPGCRR